MAYILELLSKLVDEDDDFKEMSAEDQSDALKSILRMLESEVQLRSKRELIEKFIHDQMPNISSGASVKDEFDVFWKAEKEAAFNDLCEEEALFDHEVKKSYL